MGTILFLFPDTNMFIQCKPLNELDWSVWGDFDEINLLISRPVQAEFDSQKSKGTGRLAKRARTASSLFREAILSESDFVEIRSQNPAVRLHLRQDLKADPSLAERLSYDLPDDQLVGIAAFFEKNNSDLDVRILTYDTGPMASAKMVGVAFEEIPSSWLLAPEADQIEKRANILQAELDRYKKLEPSFGIDFDGDGIASEITFYSPLEDAQVLVLMNRIRENFPEATDFGPSERQERESKDSFAFFQTREVFTPAEAKEIVKYKEERYPAWLDECESLLRGIHGELARRVAWPGFSIRLRNIGSRPAEDALITFSARGGFRILPKRLENDDESIAKELKFSRPPSVPRGSWSKQNPLAALSSLAAMQAFPTMIDSRPFSNHSLLSGKRDSDGFYWKPSRPNFPSQEISLECELWRHQTSDETFDFTIHVELAPAVVTGVVDVVIHASNMTDTFVDRIPVNIKIIQADPIERANEMVQQLVDGNSSLKLKRYR